MNKTVSVEEVIKQVIHIIALKYEVNDSVIREIIVEYDRLVSPLLVPNGFSKIISLN